MNAIKCNIDHTADSPLYRLRGKTSECVQHIVSGCTQLAQKERRRWHKWYEHKVPAVIENEQVKRMWDSTIFTDRHLEHNWPDITLVHRETHEWMKKRFNQ